MYKMNKIAHHQEIDEAKERRCLMCGEAFASSWSGERICRRCRTSAAWRQG